MPSRIQYRRGAIEYAYELLRYLRDSPCNVTRKEIYFHLQTSPNRLYKVSNYLVEQGLIKMYRKGKTGKVPKITAKGMNFLNMIDEAVKLIDYDRFREQFTSWGGRPE